MSQERTKTYEVYLNAEEISLEEIILQSESTGNTVLKARVLVEGRTIKNVTFKSDIASRAYAVPPASGENPSPDFTVLFGGVVQEILDSFTDYLLPPMKPLDSIL